MSTSFYVLETRVEHAHTCDICRKGMNEGYLHEQSGGTYCSKGCLTEEFTEKAIARFGLGEIFWTEWHDEVEGSG